MMQPKRWNVLLACLCLSLIVGVCLATTTEETSLVETTGAETTAAGTTEPVCGLAASQALAADIIQIEDPEPSGICNCNVNADCLRICGEAGGACLITIPCEEGSKYTGWCHCNDGINPIQVETAE